MGLGVKGLGCRKHRKECRGVRGFRAAEGSEFMGFYGLLILLIGAWDLGFRPLLIFQRSLEILDGSCRVYSIL